MQSKGGLPKVGPYRLLRRLSAGGMGEVYEAVHESIERRVALRMLRKEFATDDDAMARLFNEARAVNLINHPAMVQIADFSKLGRGGGYLVMEFLDGVTLGQRLRQHGGTLPVGEALRIGWLLASALCAAHDRQIIHRWNGQRPLESVPLPEGPSTQDGGSPVAASTTDVNPLAETASDGLAEAAASHGKEPPRLQHEVPQLLD